jgi:hypothetical protein
MGIMKGKAASKIKEVAVTDEGYLKVDIQDAELNVDVDVSSLATSANQTNGNQKVQLTAGELHIGEVGGSSAQIQPTLAVDTAAYQAGDCVGGKLTLTNAMRVSGGTGVLQSLFLMDRSGTQKPALEILIFNADPTSSTLTDNSAVSLHADDISKVIRRLSIAATDWVLVAGNYIADLSPGGRILAASGSANLYATIVAVGAPDFVATTDLIVRFGIMRD